jgi:hypothetical protein
LLVLKKDFLEKLNFNILGVPEAKGPFTGDFLTPPVPGKIFFEKIPPSEFPNSFALCLP